MRIPEMDTAPSRDMRSACKARIGREDERNPMDEFSEPQNIESASATTAPSSSSPIIYIIFAALCAIAVWMSLQAGSCSAYTAGWMYDNVDWTEMSDLRERILVELQEAQDSYGTMNDELDRVSLFIR